VSAYCLCDMGGDITLRGCQRGLGVIAKSPIPQKKILLPPLLSSIHFMSLAMFSISCMLVLLA
jgi:hypothetical protein